MYLLHRTFDPEEIPLTFQVGMIASDGVILASDTKLTTYGPPLDSIRSSSVTKKISIHPSGDAMYCWAGDARVGQLAVEFIPRLLRIDPGVHDHCTINGELMDTAEVVTTQIRAASKPNSDKPISGDLLIACRRSGSPELWRVGWDPFAYGTQMAVNFHILNKCVIGDVQNSGLFFLEKYWQSGRTIDELLLLAAHNVLMVGKLNPTGVDGLEIAIWRNGGKPEALSYNALNTLKTKSDILDSQIRDALSVRVSDLTSCPITLSRS